MQNTKVRERRAVRRCSKAEWGREVALEIELEFPWWCERPDYYWYWEQEETVRQEEELKSEFRETVLAAAKLLQLLARQPLSACTLWSVGDGVDIVAEEVYEAQELLERLAVLCRGD